jgi:hypothetical protein
MTRWLVALALGTALTQNALAQTPCQFRWQKGEVRSYRVSHTTHVAEVVDGNKVESESKLELVKRWQALDVDADGVATLQLTLVSMRNEQKRPNGETLLFDSQDETKGTPELREQMSKFVGQTLAILRMNAQGQVIDVKQGSKARYEAEPPFNIVLPKETMAEGMSWVRPYTLTIDPPLGTGEKYDVLQKCQCAKVEGDKATLTVATEFKTQPDSPQERLPLLQKEVSGALVFDVKAGRVDAVHFVVDKAIAQHQGAQSSYHFQSRYTEQLILGANSE